jgi:vacuolar-type H+-ATPase subunit C/Vma6
METFNGKYPFMTAFLKGEEAWLVVPAHLEKLVRTTDVAEAIDVIKNTDIGKYLDNVLITDFGEADRALWGYLDFCLKRIKRFDQMPKVMQKITDAYMEKYDVLNIKAALEGIISGKVSLFIPLGTIHNGGGLGELVKAKDNAAISAILENNSLTFYAEIIKGDKTGSSGSGMMTLETELDRQYYANLLGIARKAPDGAALVKAIGTIIDLRDLKILLRGMARGKGAESLAYTIGNGYLLPEKDLRELIVLRFEDLSSHVPYAYQNLVGEVVAGYARTRRITVIGDIVDRYELAAVKKAIAAKLMSPVMIIWYLILKEIEVRNLRLVLRAILDSVPVEEIKDYLVMKA